MKMYRWVSKYMAVVILLVVFVNHTQAQVNVRATINRDKILIGEPISLTVEAYMPLGTDFNWFSSDSIPSFTINESAKVDTAENMDGKKISQTLVITSFDSGTVYIPPFQVTVNNQPFYTDSIPVQVSYTPFDRNADYRDIKDIIEVSNKSVRYIPWIVAAIAIVSLTVLLVLFNRKKKSSEQVSVPVIPALSPYEEAMRALKELHDRGSLKGVKEYYSELNDVLRRYLSREFSIATFEKTNEELILQISRLNLSRESYTGLAQSLRMSDFVKFAKFTPEEKDNERNLETVRSSIDILNKQIPSAV